MTPKYGYVPRDHRPQRKLALAALNRFLTRHPDLRIGQALYAIADILRGPDAFNVEDEGIIAACEVDERYCSAPKKDPNVNA